MIYGWERLLFKKRFYLFIYFKEMGKEGEWERNIDAPEIHWFVACCTAQACALTRNWTHDLLVHRLVVNPLSHTSQSEKRLFKMSLLLSYTNTISTVKRQKGRKYITSMMNKEYISNIQIYSFNIYLLSTSCVLGSVPGTKGASSKPKSQLFSCYSLVKRK